MRYSDEVPYDQRRYWYFTTHGVGPGIIPKDLKVLEIREGTNDKGTHGDYICLDGVLSTDELKFYDLRELKPDEDEKTEEEYIREELNKQKMYYEIWSEYDTIHIEVEWGDWKHDHHRLDYIMKELGYTKIDEYLTEEDGSDAYSSEHVYTKE